MTWTGFCASILDTVMSTLDQNVGAVPPLAHHGPVVPSADRQSWSLRFSSMARLVADASRQSGLQVPGFRSPPGRPGVNRTVRRGGDGRCIVAVRARGRPADAVLADLIAGVVVANGLRGEDARRVRERLLAAVSSAGSRAA
jgi:hypothetical protein